MTDYWLSKLFFDIQAPANLSKWKADPESVLQDYPLSDDVRAAVLSDNLEAISPHVNAYLLRLYFSISGMKHDEMLARLPAMQPTAAPPNQQNTPPDRISPLLTHIPRTPSAHPRDRSH